MLRFIARRFVNYLILVFVATSLAYLLASYTLNPIANYLHGGHVNLRAVHATLRGYNVDPGTPIWTPVLALADPHRAPRRLRPVAARRGDRRQRHGPQDRRQPAAAAGRLDPVGRSSACWSACSRRCTSTGRATTSSRSSRSSCCRRRCSCSRRCSSWAPSSSARTTTSRSRRHRSARPAAPAGWSTGPSTWCCRPSRWCSVRRGRRSSPATSAARCSTCWAATSSAPRRPRG